MIIEPKKIIKINKKITLLIFKDYIDIIELLKLSVKRYKNLNNEDKKTIINLYKKLK